MFYIAREGILEVRNTLVVYVDIIVDFKGSNENEDSTSGAAVNWGFALVVEDTAAGVVVMGRAMLLNGGFWFTYFLSVWSRRSE